MNPANTEASAPSVNVKICGLTNLADARVAAEAGADLLGFIFYERSPRYVTPDVVREITRELRRTSLATRPVPPALVGVFVNADPALINRVVERTGIGYVQLHGDEPPELLAQVACPCIKAFRVRDESWLAQVHAWMAGLDEGVAPAGILLDAYDPSARGGTGTRFNWDYVAAARAAGALKGLDPIILAGGLDASCVGGAIDLVQPWAVDVASGVEKAPGVKDLGKVEAFIRATREGKPLRTDFWL